jgi:hypothetical protein
MRTDRTERTDHRAAMRARFPAFERLFNYEDTAGRILTANAGFRFNDRGPREIREFIHFMLETEADNVARICDLEEFEWAVQSVRSVAAGVIKSTGSNQQIKCKCDMCR